MKARSYLLLLVFLTFFLLHSAPSRAVHKGAGDLICGNCHTMHNSQGNTSLEGASGGSLFLLRGPVTSRGELHKFCLQCHGVGGSQWNVTHPPHNQKAPIVYGGNLINWDETKDFSQIGAGGDFFKEMDSNFDPTPAGAQNAQGYGHSMGLSNARPPGSDTTNTLPFNCTHCHDPHGVRSNTGSVNVYRNLLVMGWTESSSECQVCHPDYLTHTRSKLYQMKSWVGGITGTYASGGNYTPVVVNGVAIWPVYKDDATVPANNNVYDGITTKANSDDSGGTMGGWCAKCHYHFHEWRMDGSSDPWGVVRYNASGEDWLRHPVDAIINDADVSGAGVDTIDWNNYSNIPAGYKLPAANTNPDLSSQHYYADTDNEDRVFCLSCHFAHAGPYYDALRWDYLASVGSGSQTGNPVPSNRGCQQCHNR